MAKAISLELNKSVGGTYDQTRTTVLGRAAQKTLSVIQGGKIVVGTPLNAFADTITDATVTPVRECISDNGHELQFVASTAAGLMGLVLYDVNETTGVKTYVGRLNVQLPNTTHTQRTGRLVNDSGATGWRILIGTVGTVAASGGFFSVENIAKADFTSSPTTIPVATASGQKAVYWHQETGGTNNLTVCQGAGYEFDGTPGGTKIVVANGLVATPNFYNFDMSLSITTVGALGVTTDWYVSKTGTITGMSGTFLLLNNYSMCVPTADSGAPIALQGQLCLFIPTSSNMGLALVSDFGNGVTTLPSYTTRDVNDVANTNTALTPSTMHFSSTLQRIVFQLSNGTWVVKKFMNAQYEAMFGSSSNSQFRTAQPIPFYSFGGVSITSTYEHGGWLYMVHATAGQIGCTSFDLRSLWNFDFSAIISKVIDTPNSQWLGLSVLTSIRSFGKFYYRTSGFGSAAGGWVALPEDRDMSAIVSASQIQFKLQPRMERDSVTIPVQIIEGHLITQPVNEISDNWEYSFDNSSSGSPTRFAFRLKKAYTTSVPQLFFRAYDTTDPVNSLLLSFDTVANAARFEYSTNDGSSWLPLGTIPNVVGTLIRVTPTSPPGVKVRPSIREA